MSELTSSAPLSRQGDAIGQYQTFTHLGMFIGPVVTGFLVLCLSYSVLFFVFSLLPVVGALLLKFSSGKAERSHFEIDDKQISFSHSLKSLKAVLGERNVLLLAFIRTTYSLTHTVFMTLFAIYAVRSLDFSPSLVSFLFSVIGFSTTLVRVPAGRASDRMGAKRVLFITYLVIILNYVALAYVKDPLPLTFALMLFGLSSGTRAVAEWTSLTNTIPQEVKTISMSFLFNCWDIGAMVGSALSGFSLESLSFPLILLMAALVNSPQLPAAQALKSPGRKDSEESG